MPHAPQLAASVVVVASQPLFGLPSQLARFVAQVGTHVLAAQLLAVVAALTMHTLPQPPQLFRSERLSDSQPLLAFPSQLLK